MGNAGSYDYWLEDRLATGSDNTWLKKQSLYAATTFCTLLGTEMLRLNRIPDLDLGEKYRLAQSIGFGVARHGEAEIRDALFALAALADGSHDEPKKAFGQLYEDLRTAHLNKDDFAPFRKVLRDCIVDIWPVAKGETILGIVQPERQIHSVITAAREAKTGAYLMEQILVDVGAIAPDDQRPTSRKTFNAPAYAEVLAEIPTLVGRTEMQIAMGATRTQFASLAADRVLLPLISIPTLISPWRASDGIALLEELLELSTPIDSSDIRWERIQQSKRRTGIQVGSIIDAVRCGELQLGRRGNLENYAALSVLKAEIDQMSRQKQEPAFRDLITAAAFGRSVGIRIPGWFEDLAAAGHTPATLDPNPRRSVERVYVSPNDIAEFHRRYLTSATMEREFGQYRTTLITKLKAANVKTFAPGNKNFGPLYLRQDVEMVLT